MQYDYVVVGAGPSGITLGLNLMHTRKRVLFIEADNSIGGCWRTGFTEDGYFTEHSPKVLSKTGTTEFNKLLGYLNVLPEYVPIDARVGFFRNMMGKLKHFMVMDVVKLVLYFVLYLLSLHDKSVSVRDWCLCKGISRRGSDYLNMISIVLSNTYDKLSMHAFMRFMLSRWRYVYTLDQVYEPNKWLSVCSEMLRAHPHFDFAMGTRVDRFAVERDRVTGVITDSGARFTAKRYVCCVPVRSLYRMMYRSREPNWFATSDAFRRFVDRSSYTGIGFQLHYTDFVPVPERWCWSCFGDWRIIVLDKTHLLKRHSYDPDIKQVLSCVIVDLDSRSAHIGKTANECDTVEEVVKEGHRQVRSRSAHPHRMPKRLTVSKNMFWSDEFGWESLDSSFSPSANGALSYSGKLRNLFTVGPHNKQEVVVIDTAIESAKTFVREVLQLTPVF